MALTISEVHDLGGFGGRGARGKVFDITFDSSYPTGGEALTPSDLGYSAVLTFLAEGEDGYNFRYNGSTLLLAYVSGGTEVTNATNLSATVVRCFVIGRT